MSNKKYSKFQNKVLKLSIFIGIAPILVISVVSLTTVLKTRLGDISELQAQVISGAEEKIIRYLEQKMSVFNLISDLEVKNVSDIETSTLDFVAAGLKEAAGNVREISFINIDGQEVVKKSEIFRTEIMTLEYLWEEESFKSAVSGKNYFGPVYFTLNGPIMQMASQIENKNRQIIGVILAEISLESIEKEISQIKIGEKGFIYVVDKKGNLITSSNKAFARQGENLAYIPLVKDVAAGKTHNGLSAGDSYKNSLGQKVIFSSQPIALTGWSIITEWPIGDAFAVVAVMIQRFLMIMAVSLILIVAFILFFVRLVVKPVENLSRGAEEISKGNFGYQINIKTGDELEKLGERFNKMREVLKENQKLRDEFVFIAAHELRAPVTVIRGYVSMIMGGDVGPINDKAQEFLSLVMRSGDSLNKLVEDLLEVARSEAGRIEIKVKPIDVAAVVKDTLQELKVMSDAKSIKIVYKPPKDLPRILADVDKLKEVVKNLVDNAIKYSIGSGMITVRHEVKEKALITHIKDSGIGISPEDQKKLFQKFHRIKTKETEDIQGTGLGLWIIKQLLEKMNGEIWCASEKGMGSTFSFSLPLAN